MQDHHRYDIDAAHEPHRASSAISDDALHAATYLILVGLVAMVLFAIAGLYFRP
jgi:hypothetical protein